MMEINFDGLVGPSHNYAGLSLGNVASAANASAISYPRAAALQGLRKMRLLMDLGLTQGFFLPHERPDAAWLRRLGFAGDDDTVCAAAWAEDPALLRTALSASAMWTANAATVSPAPDTRDGRTHLTVANLASMAHRRLEPGETERQLRLILGASHFTVHAPVPAAFGDEGAANVMRLASRHGAAGLTIFVHGETRGGRFPARQDRRACQAVARLHGLNPARCFFAAQSDDAIQAGAFHNDVVAVANEHVLFAHELAFADKEALYEFIRHHLPTATIIEVPAADVSLEDAVSSYLFNAQLVTPPGNQGMALILPVEARANPRVWAWLQRLLASDGPIRALHLLDLRESMRNGGGPACLRLRVPADETARRAIDPRFLLDMAKWEALYALIERHWPARIAPDDLGTPDFWGHCRAARKALLDLLA